MTRARRPPGGRTDDGGAPRHPGLHERFIEGALVHVKGPHAGKPFTLLQWQRDGIVRPIFGDGSELRTIRTCYVEIPKKNGKSAFASAVALALLFVDEEPGGEVYSVAGDRDQAAITFDVAKAMVEANPKLLKQCRVYKRVIEVPAWGAIYRVLSADAPRKHGLNPHGIIFDELHVQPNRELWDTLTMGTDARAQPLTLALTTAGYDRNSICWEQHDYALKVRDGIFEDPSFLPLIFAADHDDDWTDRRIWAKANPSLGVTFHEKRLEEKCKRAIVVPRQTNTFKRLHLNIWTEQNTIWLPMEKWDACAGEVDLEALAGSRCFGGLDLSSTRDMTAFALVFPGEPPKVVVFYWLPSHELHERVLRDGVPYDTWAAEGHLQLTEGNAVDYRAIKKTILECAEAFDIEEIAFDRWNSSQLVTELMEEGLPMVAFGQGFASMSTPSKEVERMVADGDLEHGGHPILRWNASNASVKEDPAENIKPDKSKSTGRIDGLVATVMAVGRMVVNHDGGSRYDDDDEELVVI